MRSAPSRLAASTPDRPTAPSPTTATGLPGLTSAQTAAWWPVDITSDSVSSERSISSEWPEPGTVTQRAVGERDANRLALAAVAVAREEAAVTQAVVIPCRQCGQVPSLKANGAITRSPWRRSDLGADVLDDADELVADRARRERRVAAVVPEVRAADAGEDDADDGVGGLVMAGSGRSPASIRRGSWKMAARIASLCPRSSDSRGPCQRGTGRAPQRGRARSTVVAEADRGKTETVDAANDIAEFLTTRRAKITPKHCKRRRRAESITARAHSLRQSPK